MAEAATVPAPPLAPPAAAPVRTIAVCSGKGGVGKTSVSVNLSVALAQRGRSVMLLDADLAMANADVLMGVQTHGNLAHVLSGERRLAEIVCAGPAGVQLVPASSGVAHLANLSPAEHAGLIHAFSELETPLDVLIVDVAAGIADSVVMFTRAVQEVLVVVCDEPASLTDAYALIKVLSREQQVRRFQVLPNQVTNAVEGQALFRKLEAVCERFLDVQLDYVGSIPRDDYLRRAVQAQKPVVTAYPASKAARAFKDVAERADKRKVSMGPWGGVEFFVERLVAAGAAR
ncbi:MAG: MinD/ParA family protein [Pseudomonadales bacterium]|jgi:flagellar biosynthesis protein FlhG|nr:MinD/ParA family protein [Pseudomonadales bacterium]